MQLKNRDEIERMRRVNGIVREVLNTLTEMVKPGVTTLELDAEARRIAQKHGAVPAFLGYPAPEPGVAPFPAVICASKNEEIVHGIPNETPLQEGDIISVDFGCEKDGFFGDAAVTIPVGMISAEAERLLTITRQSLEKAIEQCHVGKRIGDISHAVQRHAEAAGFGVVRRFVGHGIGRAMHESPQVPNFGKAGQGRPLKAGLVLAIEPMITAGSFETKMLSDGWTAVTKDGSLSAHFEHSVAITEEGPIVLSR